MRDSISIKKKISNNSLELSVKNKNDEPIESINYYALIYDANGKVVDYSFDYIGEIEEHSSEKVQIDFDMPFADAEVFITAYNTIMFPMNYT